MKNDEKMEFTLPGQYTEKEAKMIVDKIQKYSKTYWNVKIGQAKDRLAGFSHCVTIISESMPDVTENEFYSEVILTLLRNE